MTLIHGKLVIGNKPNLILKQPLFVKKSNDEGTDFYYIGEMEPIENSFRQTKMPADGLVLQREHGLVLLILFAVFFI